MARCRLSTVGTALFIVLVLGVGTSGALAAPLTYTSEEMFAALIEPSLRPDGRLDPGKRAAILETARKLLDGPELKALEQRLDKLAAPATEPQPIFHQDDPKAPAGPAPAAAPVSPLTLNLDEPGHCNGKERLIDNLSVFLGLDGSKQPQDLGLNANMGGRAEINWGFPLLPSWGIGGQIGSSENYSDAAVHVVNQLEGTHNRWQNFTTVGVFQRTNWGLKWAAAYDFLDERYYDHIELGQWRGLLGFDVNEHNEIGSWFTVTDRNDTAFFTTAPVHLEPLSQGTLYWTHTWHCEAQTSVWVGMAEGHGRVVFSISNEPPTKNVFTYGAAVNIPLGNYVSLYGAANFLTPADTGTVDAFLGFAFYPGGGARELRHRRFAPLLPVANNPFFSVDLRQ
jgi:hypothetical protein